MTTGSISNDTKESNSNELEEMTTLQVRMPQKLKDEFKVRAKDNEENASLLVRRWIKKYLSKVDPSQSELF